MKPTQEDVARRAKVSRALVSLVMRGAPNVSKKSQAKVLKAADELGYRPNAFARSLASKENRTIGVLINDVTNPYFGSLFASLADAARALGYDILTAPGTRNPGGGEKELVDTLLEHRVAGLALLSPLMRTADIRTLATASPTVVVGRDVALPGVDVVTTDEDAAARGVIEHLYQRGHREIVHINGGNNQPARDRARAFRKVVSEYGIQPRVITGSFTEDGGQAGVELLLAESSMPTAIVAANDLNAVGAMGALQRAGVGIPDDVSVIGYDDSQIARLELVQLTSVQQALDSFGTAAMSALEQRIASPSRTRSVQRLGTRLIERRTVSTAAH